MGLSERDSKAEASIGVSPAGVCGLQASSALLLDPTSLALPTQGCQRRGACPGAGFVPGGHPESSGFSSPTSVQVNALAQALVVFPEGLPTEFKHLKSGIMSSLLLWSFQEVRVLPICAAPVKNFLWNHMDQHSNSRPTVY